MQKIRLGLIGDNIRQSRSPALHRLAGALCGFDVSHELLVPAEQDAGFDVLFERCRDTGFRGINVTYPYKERAFDRVTVEDPAVRRLGACNTVLFGDPPTGENTDYTGFQSAFAAAFGRQDPGRVAMAGAGGVGKAIAFALAELGAPAIRVFDRDRAKADRLVGLFAAAAPGTAIESVGSIAEAMDGADGLVNCTPLGMTGHPGSSMPKALMRGRGWAFDAVYTPLETAFLQSAGASGLAVLSGYELFFHQGIDAFRLFTGVEPEPGALRQALLQEAQKGAVSAISR
ncbi:shikimate dehydrogenase family protein [Amorphus sp. MBR-141]